MVLFLIRGKPKVPPYLGIPPFPNSTFKTMSASKKHIDLGGHFGLSDPPPRFPNERYRPPYSTHTPSPFLSPQNRRINKKYPKCPPSDTLQNINWGGEISVYFYKKLQIGGCQSTFWRVPIYLLEGANLRFGG